MVGYPKEKLGYMFEHTGPIENVMPRSKGGFIISYKVDTTPGNSGSPISLVEEDIIRSTERFKSLCNRYDRMGEPHNLRKITIGVNKVPKLVLDLLSESVWTPIVIFFSSCGFPALPYFLLNSSYLLLLLTRSSSTSMIFEPELPGVLSTWYVML